MKRCICISKVNHAEFFRLLFDRYATSGRAEIDCKDFGPDAFERLKREWCSSRKIRDTREFRFSVGDREVASFHDSVDELFVGIEEEDWLHELSNQGLLRFHILPVDGSLSLFQRIKAWFTRGQKEPIQPPQTTPLKRRV